MDSCSPSSVRRRQLSVNMLVFSIGVVVLLATISTAEVMTGAAVYSPTLFHNMKSTECVGQPDDPDYATVRCFRKRCRAVCQKGYIFSEKNSRSATYDCIDGEWLMKGGEDICIPVCETPCKNGRYCSAPNQCTCHNGYEGASCEITCANGGSCGSEGTELNVITQGETDSNQQNNIIPELNVKTQDETDGDQQNNIIPELNVKTQDEMDGNQQNNIIPELNVKTQNLQNKVEINQQNNNIIPKIIPEKNWSKQVKDFLYSGKNKLEQFFSWLG